LNCLLPHSRAVAQRDNPVRYVLYHPGFTKSGDLSPLPAVLRASIRAAARVSARPVAESVAPIHGFIDNPPDTPLTAIDRMTAREGKSACPSSGELPRTPIG
jgi:pyocin large subunit-like protein